MPVVPGESEVRVRERPRAAPAPPAKREAVAKSGEPPRRRAVVEPVSRAAVAGESEDVGVDPGWSPEKVEAAVRASRVPSYGLGQLGPRMVQARHVDWREQLRQAQEELRRNMERINRQLQSIVEDTRRRMQATNDQLRQSLARMTEDLRRRVSTTVKLAAAARPKTQTQSRLDELRRRREQLAEEMKKAMQAGDVEAMQRIADQIAQIDKEMMDIQMGAARVRTDEKTQELVDTLTTARTGTKTYTLPRQYTEAKMRQIERQEQRLMADKSPAGQAAQFAKGVIDAFNPLAWYETAKYTYEKVREKGARGLVEVGKEMAETAVKHPAYFAGNIAGGILLGKAIGTVKNIAVTKIKGTPEYARLVPEKATVTEIGTEGRAVRAARAVGRLEKVAPEEAKEAMPDLELRVEVGREAVVKRPGVRATEAGIEVAQEAVEPKEWRVVRRGTKLADYLEERGMKEMGRLERLKYRVESKIRGALEGRERPVEQTVGKRYEALPEATDRLAVERVLRKMENVEEMGEAVRRAAEKTGRTVEARGFKAGEPGETVSKAGYVERTMAGEVVVREPGILEAIKARLRGQEPEWRFEARAAEAIKTTDDVLMETTWDKVLGKMKAEEPRRLPEGVDIPVEEWRDVGEPIREFPELRELQELIKRNAEKAGRIREEGAPRTQRAVTKLIEKTEEAGRLREAGIEIPEYVRLKPAGGGAGIVVPPNLPAALAAQPEAPGGEREERGAEGEPEAAGEQPPSTLLERLFRKLIRIDRRDREAGSAAEGESEALPTGGETGGEKPAPPQTGEAGTPATGTPAETTPEEGAGGEGEAGTGEETGGPGGTGEEQEPGPRTREKPEPRERPKPRPPGEKTEEEEQGGGGGGGEEPGGGGGPDTGGEGYKPPGPGEHERPKPREKPDEEKGGEEEKPGGGDTDTGGGGGSEEEEEETQPGEPGGEGEKEKPKPPPGRPKPHDREKPRPRRPKKKVRDRPDRREDNEAEEEVYTGEGQDTGQGYAQLLAYAYGVPPEMYSAADFLPRPGTEPMVPARKKTGRRRRYTRARQREYLTI